MLLGKPYCCLATAKLRLKCLNSILKNVKQPPRRAEMGKKRHDMSPESGKNVILERQGWVIRALLALFRRKRCPPAPAPPEPTSHNTLSFKQKRMNKISILAAFLGGAVVGAAAGLLFAPEKGADTREKIAAALRKRGIRLSGKDLEELADDLAEDLTPSN